MLKSLELGLARIERQPVEVDMDHFIDRRMKTVKRLFDILGDGDMGAALQELVDLLHDIDPTSYESRYPATTKWEVPALIVGVRVAGILAVPFVNVSLIARLLRKVELLVYTSSMVEEYLENRYYEERDAAINGEW